MTSFLFGQSNNVYEFLLALESCLGVLEEKADTEKKPRQVGLKKVVDDELMFACTEEGCQQKYVYKEHYHSTVKLICITIIFFNMETRSEWNTLNKEFNYHAFDE